MARTKFKAKTWQEYLKRWARECWGWSKERKVALMRASVGPELWKCEQCDREPLQRAERQVDHVEPVENVGGWDNDWNAWLGRLFCPIEGLMVLCLECHKAKSERENAQRPHRKGRKRVKKEA